MTSLQTGATLAVLLVASTASATPRQKAGAPKVPNACAAAYRTAQEREEAGHLREARTLLVSCAKARCGAALMQECTAMHAQLESDLPTFVPVVLDDAGVPRTDVEVRVDGELMTSRIDGRPLAIDPGAHQVTFTTDGGTAGEQKFALVTNVDVTIDPHDRSRPIAITLPGAKRHTPAPVPVAAAAPTPVVLDKPALAIPETPPKQGRSVFPYVLGGAGLVALGAGALLTYWGRKDNDQLAQCSPNCRDGAISHIQTMYVAADISLGAGVVALGVATVLLATSRSDEAKAPARSAYVFDVKPTPAGAAASLSGSF